MDIKLVVIDPDSAAARGAPQNAAGWGAVQQRLRIEMSPEEAREFIRWLGDQDLTEYSFRLFTRVQEAVDVPGV